MSLDTLIRDVQNHLGLVADGKPGPLTWAAIHERIAGGAHDNQEQYQAILAGGTVDKRSESNIITLHPRVQAYARNLVLKAAAIGITIRIISGLRSYAEQDAIYASSRSVPGPWRTNARGGYSNHNFGLAFDIGVFSGANYLEESPLYKAVATIGIDLGLAWGGNWKSKQDQPHFELRPAWAAGMNESTMLTELRRRKDTGRDYFA